jgi:hypothetical protein
MYDSNQFQGKYSQITHIVDNDTMKHLWFSIAAAFIVSIFTAVVNFDPQEAAALENSITQENNPTQINSNSPSMTITQSSIQSEPNQNSEQNAMQVNDVEQTNNFNSDADSTIVTEGGKGSTSENSITQENNPTQINSNSPSMTITQSSIQSEDCSRECGNANQNSEQNAMQVNDVEQTNNFNSDADSTMTTRS